MRAACFAALLALVVATPAWPDEFADFRIPDHKFFVCDASLSGCVARNREGLETGQFDDNDAVSLSLTYKLAGRIDAPGLIDPIRIH